MPKTHSQYVCQQCGYSQVGWAGKCPNCGAWGSLVETVLTDTTRRGVRGSKKTGKVEAIFLSSIPLKKTSRISTQIQELDRVLGGGLVPGQVVLIAGEPGIGKSTLLTQLAENLSDKKAVLYVSGEESPGQIRLRADRLGLKSRKILILDETDCDLIVEAIGNLGAEKVSCVIVDSIQTIATDDLSGLAGSVGQVRECAFRLLKATKPRGMPLFLVGHVTKEGTVAGPSVLAHIVDTVLWFEGEKNFSLRLLRAVKNRFGATDEVGIFSMEEKGLKSLSDPEKLFLTKMKESVSGSVITCILEGSRPILVEVQSLVSPTRLAFPKRIVQGVDSRRCEVILAVLSRRCGLPLGDFDVFVNVVGGIILKEPAADLAVALSVASAFLDKPLGQSVVPIGEVGLLGEIREVPMQEKRVREAKRLGFNKVITSKEEKYLASAIKDYLRK